MGCTPAKEADTASASERKFTLKAVKEIFDMADTDCSGYLDAKEVAAMIAFGDKDDADVQQFIKDADKDNNGKVEREEVQAFFLAKQDSMKPNEFTKFLEQFKNKAQGARSAAVKERAEAMYNLVDADKSGSLEPAEIVKFISFGDEDEESKKFLEDCDKDKDGKVTFPELHRFFDNKARAMDEPRQFWEYFQGCENKARQFEPKDPKASGGEPAPEPQEAAPAAPDAVVEEAAPEPQKVDLEAALRQQHLDEAEELKENMEDLGEAIQDLQPQFGTDDEPIEKIKLIDDA